MDYLKLILTNQDLRTEKTKAFEKQANTIIQSKETLVKEMTNKINDEVNSVFSDKNTEVYSKDYMEEVNKLVKDSFLKEFQVYGEEIQKLNSELRSLLKEIDVTNKDYTKTNKLTSLTAQIHVELSDFVNNLLLLEKSNFETLLKSLQTTLKISQFSNSLFDQKRKYNSSGESESNDIRELLKSLEQETSEFKKTLNITRERISDLISEKKYLIIS